MGYSVDPITGAMVGHPHTIGDLSNVDDAADAAADGQVLTWDVGGGWASFATDTFTRADSTNLGVTETGAVGWTETDFGGAWLGDLSIVSNQIKNTGAAYKGAYIGVSNLDHKVEVQTATGNYAAIAIRWDNATRSYIAAQWAANTTNIDIIKVVANVATVVASYFPGTRGPISLEAVGDNVALYLNGALLGSYVIVDAALRVGTSVGFSGDPNAIIDDFEAFVPAGQWHAETPASSGAQGPMGPWIMGPEGDDGPMGMPVPGAPGSQGTAGSQGPAGGPGPPGFALDGDEGAEGMAIPGPVGATGASGAPGGTGPQGPTGPWLIGPEGDDGPEGFSIPGPTGLTGNTGNTGNTGPAGAQGLMGPPGSDGDPDEPILMPGPAGVKGDTGASGGAGTQTAFTKDLGTSRNSGTFAVTGLASLTSGNSYDVRQSAAQISTKGNARDEAEMDTIVCTAYADSTTSLAVYWWCEHVVVGTYAFVSIT